ncbi:hypothetical protein BD01_1850 [Thermococcus nautili]|uniref:Uncharacterized protein n=1 Tax=Thermococcus nautili TaxID=195522 RepID=W8NW82_9EURY|nr:hypothetical protein BD01_1850 [Thermococcus nautili]
MIPTYSTTKKIASVKPNPGKRLMVFSNINVSKYQFPAP